MPFRILLIDPDSESRALIEKFLSEAGYSVACSATFEEAARQMSSNCPDLLITAARLGPFNGLHLVIRYQTEYPDTPMVVMHDVEDPLLRSEVLRYGARFIKKPANRKSFLRQISQLLVGRSPRSVVSSSTRRWPRKNTELPVAVARTLGRVVDLSYGGLRLELEGSPSRFASSINIDLPSLGLSFTAYPRWTRPRQSGDVWWCGAEIAPTDTEPWRSFVDSV